MRRVSNRKQSNEERLKKIAQSNENWIVGRKLKKQNNSFGWFHLRKKNEKDPPKNDI